MESILSYFLTASRRHRTLPAFTLIELLVSLGIMTVLMAVLLLGQSNFSRSIELTDTAYTVAVSVRQMESYGISSRYFSNNSYTATNAGYGLHFDSSTPTTYYEFADVRNVPTALTGGNSPIGYWCPTGEAGTPEEKPGDCVYDGPSEQLASIAINSGFHISNICGFESGNLLCSSTSGGGSLDMVFVRPNTQSIMTGYFNGGLHHFTTACVQLSSPDNATTRMVRVTNLGEVSVQDSPTCNP